MAALDSTAPAAQIKADPETSIDRTAPKDAPVFEIREKARRNSVITE
jgi:hypothetical protein